MGVYGIDLYGWGYFGRDPDLVRPDFSVAPFESMPLDYSTLHLTWKRPPSQDCAQLQLVRNIHNLPQDETDGAILFTSGLPLPVSYTDTTLAGGFVYYTMFGLDGNPTSPTYQMWLRCTDLIGLVPLNWGYGWRLYNLLPAAYRDRDGFLVDPYNPWPVDDARPPLRRFLSMLGFQLDFIRTELESLMSINDAINCSGAVLPLMAQQFGLVHEPEIGMAQERQLVQNAVHLYKLKGSPRGLTDMASILTSYPSSVIVHHGYNELLTLDDGIFYDGVGTWRPWPPPGITGPLVSGSNLGLTMSAKTNMLDGSIPSMTTGPLSLYPGMDTSMWQPAYNNSGLKVSATGTNLVTVANSDFESGVGSWVADNTNTTLASQAGIGYTGTHCLKMTAKVAGAIAAHVTGQAVTAGTSYVMSAVIQGYTTPATSTTPAHTPGGVQCYATIGWFNSSGSLIGSVPGMSFSDNANSWTTLTASGTAPAGAVTAWLIVTAIAGAAGESHLIDTVQFGSGGQNIVITTSRIPVTDFISSTYMPGQATFRIAIWSTVARTVSLSLWGNNNSGTAVQIVAPTPFNEVANTWTQMQISTPMGGINPYPGGVANSSNPAAYYWIYPRITIQGAGNESHYISLCGLWPCLPADIGVDTGPNAYDYPRDVKVTLSPQNANLLTNQLTTFTREDPATDQMHPIGFDGLCTADDPINPGAATTTLAIRYTDVESPAATYAVTGNASLQIGATGPDNVLWLGRLGTAGWNGPPPNPNGWFSNTNVWFPGAVQGSAGPRPWVDVAPGIPPTNSWWMINGRYYGLGSGFTNGVWFAAPPAPPQNCNVQPFTITGNQQLNFSLSALYLTVQDPSNALMQMGFRWYYPDGTWTEESYSYYLTNSYYDSNGQPIRYSVPPSDPSMAYLGTPPVESSTGVLPNSVLPFVRFPSAQQARFLLNTAILSPGLALPAIPTSTPGAAGAVNVMQDSATGAIYYYRRLIPRTARLNEQLYRWLPAGTSYSLVYAAGGVQAPLDPTLW